MRRRSFDESVASENPGLEGLGGKEPVQDAADGDRSGCRGDAGDNGSYRPGENSGDEVERRDWSIEVVRACASRSVLPSLKRGIGRLMVAEQAATCLR